MVCDASADSLILSSMVARLWAKTFAAKNDAARWLRMSSAFASVLPLTVLLLPLMRSSSYRDSSRRSLSMKNLSTKMSLSTLAIVLILSESLLGAFLRPGHFDDFAADKRSLAPCRCLQLVAGPASTDTD